MHNTPTPSPLTSTSTQRGRLRIARRARIEHLAMSLLRLADAVRLPVPVDSIWRSPPEALWTPPSAGRETLLDDPEAPFLPRLKTARQIARFVDESAWALRERLLGKQAMTADERDIFAQALLMPTALLATLSAHQRRPAIVSRIFQVPEKLAEERLHDLGYL